MHVLDDQVLKRLPENFGNLFPSLTNLQLTGSQLNTILAKHFKHFPILENFFSPVNEVKVIDGDLFKFTPKIQVLCFSENLIEHAGHDLLIGLVHLRSVNFRRNPCINVMISKGFDELNRRLPIDCLETTVSTSTSTTAETPEVCS